MLTTDGECRIGASIGPICSSMSRVSWNGSRSGISSQRRRGAPMSTVKLRVAVAAHRQEPGLGLEQKRGRRAGRAMTGSSRIAQATQRVPLPQAPDSRAVGVVDAQEGVGAGRARIVQHHELVEARARVGRDGARLLGRDLAASCRAGRRSTISLPRPFILRKRRFARALITAAIWAKAVVIRESRAACLESRPEPTYVSRPGDIVPRD